MHLVQNNTTIIVVVKIMGINGAKHNLHVVYISEQAGTATQWYMVILMTAPKSSVKSRHVHET